MVAAVFSFGLFFIAHAQPLQVTDGATDPYTPTNLITDVFLGEGVRVLNVQFNGEPIAVGYFSGGQSTIGIDRGIVMTTGQAVGGAGRFGPADVGRNQASTNNPSTATCPSLKALTSNTIEDVATYEITFIPTSDTLRFRYCFASEEYPEYGCSDYNDIFGFFITGPGYPTPTNIALIPGTNLPVAINNIHPIDPTPETPNCTPLNVPYFRNNDVTDNQPVYDGYTTVFTAEAVVVPCATYTIKLAIADVRDQIYDSGVFLEAKSFGTGSLKAEVITPSINGIIAEDCEKATLRFTLPEPAKQNVVVDVRIFGTATPGVDLQALPPTFVIPQGQTFIDIPLIALSDNRTEAMERLFFDVRVNPCQRDTISIGISDNLLKSPKLTDTLLCVGASPTIKLDGSVPVQVPPPPTFSNTADFDIYKVLFQPVKSPNSPIVVSGVTPTVLGPNVLRSVCINVNHDYTDDLDIFLIAPNGKRIILSSDNGGNGNNYTNTCFTPTASTKITAGTAPFTGNFAPEEPFSDLYGSPVNGTWRLNIIDDQFGINGTLLDWTINFEPSYKVDYTWTPNSNISCTTCPTVDVNPPQTTTYHLKVSDSYGCAFTDSAKVEVKAPLIAPIVSCADTGLTSVTFAWTTTVPGALGYEINLNNTGWNPAPVPSLLEVNNLSPSTPVNLKVRAIGGPVECSPLVANRTCVNCADISASVNVTMVSCFGGSDGAIRITPTNINPPYKFKLNNQANSTGFFNNLPAGTYTYSIIDGSNCEKMFTQTIIAPAALTANLDKQDVSCFGKNDGALTVLATGGTGTKTFTWSPTKPATATINGLSPGTYAVTVRDTRGCTTTIAATITQPEALVGATSTVNVKCFGQPTGTISLSASGGNQPYTYKWSNGATSGDLANVQAGTYTVTISDVRGCTQTSNATITQPTAISAVPSSTPVKCYGDANGTASVTASGGVGSYLYVWDIGKTGASVTGLTARTYAVSISDDNGCVLVQSVTVDAPLALSASTAKVDVSCFDGKNGSATATAQGGTGTYTYRWSDAAQQSAPTAINLIAGNYTVTITDQNNCSFTTTASVNQPTALRATFVAKNVHCFGESNGSLEAALKGGTAPYRYAWSSGATVASPSGLAAGTYLLTVTDFNACTAVFRDSIGQPPQILLTPLVDSVKCFGANNGAIQTNATGGMPGFSFKWTGPNNFNATGAAIDQLFAGNYDVLVTDLNGCTKNMRVRVEEPAELAIALPAVADTVCFAASNGTAFALPKGGTAPYQYLWTNNQTSATATGLRSDAYSVTVTDLHNCTQTAKTVIRQKAELFTLAAFENPRCRNGVDGTANVTEVFYGPDKVNSLAGFRYVWNTSPAQTTRQALQLKANGTYTVTIYDADGCSAERSVKLGNPDTLVARVPAHEDVKCYGDSTGWAAANGVGGAAPYTYYWGGTVLSGQRDSLARGFPAGLHAVTVTDARGCQATTEVAIRQPPQIQIRMDRSNVKCKDGIDGSVKAVPSGGMSPYRYVWQGGESTAAISQLKAGQYTVTVFDASECQMPQTVEILQPAEPLSGNVKVKDAVCYGAQNGSVEINGIGGTPPYRYTLDQNAWNGSPLQIGLSAGTYLPKVIDDNGCIFELRSVSVQQQPPMVVDLGEDITIDLGNDTTLQAIVSAAVAPYQFTWAREGTQWLSCMDCEAPDVTQLYFTHAFKVAVKDARGCIGEDEIVVRVEKVRRIFVAEGFTPNDDGNNDLLMVHGQTNAKILTFKVFDRWGELVYQAEAFQPNDRNIGWDGTFRGAPMDPALFVWVLEVEYLDGSTEILKGNTTLIR